MKNDTFNQIINANLASIDPGFGQFALAKASSDLMKKVLTSKAFPIPTDHTAGCHGSQRTAAARFSAMKALRSSRTHGMTSANRTKSGLFHFCRITPISRERNPSGRSLFLPYASPAVRKRLRVRRVFAPEAKSVLDSPAVSLKKTGGATQSAVVGFAPDEIRVNIHGCDRANRKHHNHCQNPGFRQYTS